MDFKGVTWAGNIYQKFEAMCLEVEEAMYQDTVKYVENQVQKVGVSVKKFYSEVMEDLIPPSCVHPVNLASGDLPLSPYGHIDDVKKPIPSTFDSTRDLKKKENEDQVISTVTAEKESSLSGYYNINSLSPQSPGMLVQNKCSESCAAISKKVGARRRPVGIKRISKNNHPSKDLSRVTSLPGDRRSKLASIDMSSSRVASDVVNVTSSSDLDVSRKPGAVKENIPIPDTPIESPASDKTLSAESVMRSSSRMASDDINVMPSSELHMSRGPGEAVKGNVPIPDTPIESPASDKILSAESVMRSSSMVASDDINVMSSSDFDVRHEPGEAVKGNVPIPDTPIESPASDKILSAESVRQNKDDLDCIFPASDKILPVESVRQNKDDSDCISPTSDNNLSAEPVRLNGDSESTSSCCDLPAESSGISVVDFSFSLSGSSVRSKACNLESEDKGVTVSDEGTSMRDDSSSVRTTLCKAESWDKEIIMSNEDSFNMVENELVAEPRLENFEPVERINLEESCVLVEGDILQCAPHGTRKHKSYKKKIREALTSKLRSRKDNQCISQHKGSGRKNKAEAAIPDLAVDSENQKLSAHHSLESDWELL